MRVLWAESRIIDWSKKVESFKNLINDRNQRGRILKEILGEPVSEFEKWVKAEFELEIKLILDPFYDSILEKLNEGETTCYAVEKPLYDFTKSRYASPLMLEKADKYIKKHDLVEGFEAIALRPNITPNIFQDMVGKV